MVCANGPVTVTEVIDSAADPAGLLLVSVTELAALIVKACCVPMKVPPTWGYQ